VRLTLELLRLDPDAWVDRNVVFGCQAAAARSDAEEPIELSVRAVMGAESWKRAGRPVQLAVSLSNADQEPARSDEGE
jgi:hypothetical protein